MNNSVRTVLKKLIEKHGIKLCKDARLTEGLLKDHCGEYKGEINVLVTAIKLGITEEMLRIPDKTVYSYITRWANKLRKEGGIDQNITKWVLKSWLIATGKNNVVGSSWAISEAHVTHERAKKTPLQDRKLEQRIVVDFDRLRSYEEAIKAYSIATQANPEDWEAQYNLGIAHGKKGNHLKAIGALKKALCVNPRHAEVYCNLGVAYYNLKRYSEAMESFEDAISIDPNYAEAHFYVGLVYLALGKEDFALKECETLRGLGRHNLADNLCNRMRES